MSNDFLFELGCEELPSAAVKTLANALQTEMRQALEKTALSFRSINVYASPRRLAVLVEDLPETQPVQHQQRRGPAVQQAFDAEGNPSRALEGFARSCGVTIDQLQRTHTEKGEWMIYEQTIAGQKTCEILPEIMLQVIRSLPVAKPMRWGDGEEEFVRPVHWLLALWGDVCLPMHCFGIQSSNQTRGHRFHANRPITVKTAKAYVETLKGAQVLADFTERRNEIVSQIHRLAESQNAEAIIPPALLDEVTSIVEWPKAIMATFDKNFLNVPDEALIASMQEHQKCFALRNKKGALMPAFISICNIESREINRVIHANEKVMRARLSDAAFFYEQDKKTALAVRIEATRRVVFQNKLGSLFDKAQRLRSLMLHLAEDLSLDRKEAQRAADLSKCDLLTGMVGEFPELQGIMGYYYALQDKESETVALALKEQYMPRFSKDALPDSLLGKSLSLADRLDTLTGIFAIGQKPSGVKDPFKLRRHALAVVRLLIVLPFSLSLQAYLDRALSAYAPLDLVSSQHSELKAFILDRLLSYYLEQDFSHAQIQAVLAIQNDDLFDFDQRLKALAEFEHRSEANALSAACKRVDNILRQQTVSDLSVKDEFLHEPAEKKLSEQIGTLSKQVFLHQRDKNYPALLRYLAELKIPVDHFFDTVMVMVEDESLRNNRLALLANLQALLKSVADISLL